MTTPRGFRDRSDDSLFTLIGDLPELVRNLITAEIDSAKAWLGRTAKDAGIGAGWAFGALFFLFWAIPSLGAFFIAGLASWWPVWLSALVVFGIMVLIAAILGLLGVLRFRRIGKSENPVKAVSEDIRIVKEAGDDFNKPVPVPRTAVALGITDPVEKARAEFKAALAAIEDKANVPKRVARTAEKKLDEARRFSRKNPVAATVAVVAAAAVVGAIVWGVVKAYTR